ncbi:hypothetical protein [Citrobacter portucalensis]|uniref:hypothetical protein n=1 Tax=Citrobacter portucalensis TaxID=1639133 RepID=UPI002889939E|nr:hypothetical protein [Citrobacter portucalensis]WNI84118.1 hypothetical protein RIK60_00250 [Citrobacter portucalensis]
MFKSSIAVIATLIAFSSLTHANMRAPMHINHAPSFSLAVPQTGRLTVEKEKLNIDCDYQHCDVQAVYFVRSDTPEDLAFIFVLPENTPVEARVTGTLRSTSVTKDEMHTWTSPEPDGRQLPLYQAAFSGSIKAGMNIINIKYRQPLTILERAYGYFTDSRSIEQFTYQLGPLKEWTLADNFSLQVTLSSLRKRPERDGGWSLMKSRAIDCLQPDQVQENDSDHLNLMLTFGKNFPDTLVCQIGDSDLLDSTE